MILCNVIGAHLHTKRIRRLKRRRRSRDLCFQIRYALGALAVFRNSCEVLCLFKRLHRKLCRCTLLGLRKCILYLPSDALQSFSTAESCEMERLCLGAALFFQLPGCSLYARPSFPCHLAIFRTDVVGVRVFKIQRACHSLNMYTVWLRAGASQTTGGGKPAASEQIARSQGAESEH